MEREVTLGAEIRLARQARGLSQRALACAARTSQSVVARIEAGRVSPSLTTLAAIADALGVDLVIDLRPPALDVLRAELARDHESLLQAWTARRPSSSSGRPVPGSPGSART